MRVQSEEHIQRDSPPPSISAPCDAYDVERGRVVDRQSAGQPFCTLPRLRQRANPALFMTRRQEAACRRSSVVFAVFFRPLAAVSALVPLTAGASVRHRAAVRRPVRHRAAFVSLSHRSSARRSVSHRRSRTPAWASAWRLHLRFDERSSDSKASSDTCSTCWGATADVGSRGDQLQRERVYNFPLRRLTPYATFGIGVEWSSLDVKTTGPARGLSCHRARR